MEHLQVIIMYSPVRLRHLESVASAYLVRTIDWRSIFLLLPALFLSSCFSIPNSSTQNREVPRVFSTVPTFPKFSKVSSSQITKAGRIVVTTYFKSAATYDEVERFYTSSLIPDGWTMSSQQDIDEWFTEAGGKELDFSKAGASVVIQYRGDNAGNRDWNYAVTFIWNIR